MNRPSIKSPCVADTYHDPGVRIAEVSFPDGQGCLIRLSFTDGKARIEIYRKDPGVKVSVSKIP